MRLHYNGVGISGTGIKLVNYPTVISSVLSMEVLKQKVYFAAVGVVAGPVCMQPPKLGGRHTFTEQLTHLC